MDEPKPDKITKMPISALRYASLSTQWLILLLLAVWGGHQLDNLLHWKIPVCLILCPLAALVISLWQLLKELEKK